MNKTYKIVKAFQKDNTLRASYQQLAKEIHGIDFEDWYQNGYWKNNYIPYSIVEGAQILANVAVSPKEENLTFFTKGTFFDRFEEDHLRIPIMAHT